MCGHATSVPRSCSSAGFHPQNHKSNYSFSLIPSPRTGLTSWIIDIRSPGSSVQKSIAPNRSETKWKWTPSGGTCDILDQSPPPPSAVLTAPGDGLGEEPRSIRMISHFVIRGIRTRVPIPRWSRFSVQVLGRILNKRIERISTGKTQISIKSKLTN